MATTKEFQVQGQTITVRQCFSAVPGIVVPAYKVLYLHSAQDNGEAVWQQCLNLGCSDFALVSISGLEWNTALTPWECEGIFAEDEPFAGQAARQLDLLTSEIIPAAEQALSLMAQRVNRTIAGYSLAGLFAVWSAFNCSCFNRVASASGSLWYPGFAEYAATHEFVRKPEAAYFSLGNKEHKTPSRLLRNVAEGTRQVEELFASRGVRTMFEKNPGNHFKDPDLRMAKAIQWVLQ